MPGLCAKPIIDILMGVQALDPLDQLAPQMEALGYEVMGAFGMPGRRYFRKDNAQGRRTHQVHAFELTSPHLARHLAFRDYLRAHSEVATAYGALKRSLQGQTSEAYMDGKDPFIQRVEQDALTWALTQAPTKARG